MTPSKGSTWDDGAEPVRAPSGEWEDWDEDPTDTWSAPPGAVGPGRTWGPSADSPAGAGPSARATRPVPWRPSSSTRRTS